MNGRRVENLGENVSAWCDRTHEGSSTWDVCEEHAEYLDDDPSYYDNDLVPYGDGEPSGDAGRGGDVEHPPYADGSYHCALAWCRVRLQDA
jgi:hypothetical protein